MEVVTVVAMAVKMEEDKAIAADAMEAMAEERGNPNGGGRNGGGGPRPTCQVCGKYGHDALRCRNRFNHAFQPDEPRPRNANVAHANNTSDSNWYFDSGATDHLTADLDRLSFQERYNGKDSVQVANGAGLQISHTGHSQINGSSRPLLLNNILRVPNMSKNLLCVHKLLRDNNAYAKIFPFHFYIKDQARKALLLRGRCQDSLYPVPSNVISSSSPRRLGLTSSTLSAESWHRRLGHPSNKVIESVIRSNKIACALPSQSSVCDSCQRAKVHQLSYARSSHVTSSTLELVHSDVWGTAHISTGGFRYYVCFVDDFSRYTWIYLIKHKSDVEQSFYHFQTHVERLLQTKIRMVQTDGGGEYRRLSRFFSRIGIQHRLICPHTSKQNGIAERKHMHIVETGIALLAHSSLPIRFGMKLSLRRST
jgi:histone deacetylase 1/2